MLLHVGGQQMKQTAVLLCNVEVAQGECRGWVLMRFACRWERSTVHARRRSTVGQVWVLVCVCVCGKMVCSVSYRVCSRLSLNGERRVDCQLWERE